MDLRKFAEREFVALGYDLNDEEEGPNKWIMENVFELLEVFSKQDHSGMSAPFCIGYFTKLAAYEPLSPIQGTDDEWVEVSDGMWQNSRCFHVFKGLDGRAYDIEGKIFREPGGIAYTNFNSRVYIEFPYIPKREYVDVPAEEGE